MRFLFDSDCAEDDIARAFKRGRCGMWKPGLRSFLALCALACAVSAFRAHAEDPPATPPPAEPKDFKDLKGGSGSSDSRPFLLLVDTAECKLFLYKMETSNGGHVVLNSHREYLYDLAFDEWPPAKGKGGKLASTEDAESAIRKSEDYKKSVEEKKAKDVESFLRAVLQIEKGKGKGKTLVVSGGMQGVEAEGLIELSVYRQTFIYLTDHAHHRILTYQIDGDKLQFVATRNIEYDLKLPNSSDIGSYNSFEEVKELYKKWEKKQKEKEKDKEAGK